MEFDKACLLRLYVNKQPLFTVLKIMTDSTVGEFRRSQPAPAWADYTQSGNQHMQRHQPQQARDCYCKALVLAEKLMVEGVRQRQEPDVIHLYAMSCNNLADSFQALGKALEAETILLKSHSTLMALLDDRNLALPVRQEAYQGLHRALAQLIGFYNQTQQPAALEEVTTQFKRHSQQFLRELTQPCQEISADTPMG